MNSFTGHYFDGSTAAALRVQVQVAGGRLRILPADGAPPLRELALAELDISEPCRHAPLLLHMGDGGSLEVEDAAGLAAALGNAGRRTGTVARLQQWWPGSLAALVLLLAGLLLAYTHGLPAAARWVVFTLPPEVEQSLGEQVLATLKATGLEPSRLPQQRRDTIRQMFREAAALSAPGLEVRLEFLRDADGAVVGGFNAYALPGGTIIVLDGLVGNTDEQQMLGVLGHELGHVAHRHSMRNLVQALGLAAAAGMIWGDVSAAAANAPVLLGVLRYSREFEREADGYAARFLDDNGLTSQPLIEVLQKMERLEGGGLQPGLLHTHPGMSERIEYLREAQAALQR